MTRRHIVRRIVGLISALFAVKTTHAAISGPAPRIDPDAVEAFNKPYAEFISRYMGCGAPPPTPKDPSIAGEIAPVSCYWSVSYTDLESFRRAREAAKTLFGLR